MSQPHSRDLGYDQATAWQQDWNDRMEQELRDEGAFEARVESQRFVPHRPRIGSLGPNFCERCGSNVWLHETVPYGEKASTA